MLNREIRAQVALLTFTTYGMRTDDSSLVCQIEGLYNYWRIMLGLDGNCTYTHTTSVIGPTTDELCLLVQRSFPPATLPERPIRADARPDFVDLEYLRPAITQQTREALSCHNLWQFSIAFWDTYLTPAAWVYYLPAVLLAHAQGLELPWRSNWHVYVPLLDVHQRACLWWIVEGSNWVVLP